MSAATMTGLIASRAAYLSRRLVAPTFALLILASFLSLTPLRLAAVGVFCLAVIIGLLIEPAVGLLLIAVAIPWGSVIPSPFPGVGVVDVLVGVVLIAWLARGVARREIKIAAPALVWPLLIFVWIAGATLTRAISWRDGLPEWLKWVEFAALYIAGIQVLGGRSARMLVAALMLAGVSQAALGAYQFFRQAGPEGFILMGRFMRAYGTLNQPNPYAGYLGYLAPVAASLALAGMGRWWRTKQSGDLIGGVMSTGVTLALAAGILMSWSRGAWLGLGASLLAITGLRNRSTAVVASVATGALIFTVAVFGVGWLPDPIEGRVLDLGSYVSDLEPAHTEITDANFSVLERLAHWRAGWRMFEGAPWLGVGIGNYAARYAQYSMPYWYEPLGHAHNVFINFLAETGVFGFVSFLVFWLAVGLTAARRAWHNNQSWGAALAIGLMGTWVYLTVHSLFDNLFVQHLQLQLALLLAALSSTQETNNTGEAYEPRPTTRISHVI